MNWSIIIPILVQNVPAFVDELVKLFSQTTPPTAEQWAALQSMTKVKALAVMVQVLNEQGIDPNSEQGKAFIALVS